MKRLLLVTSIFSIAFLFSGCAQLQNITKSYGNNPVKVEKNPEAGVVAVIDSNIIVAKPVSNSLVTSPLKIEGRARVFEGNVEYRILDAANQVLASGFTTASAAAPGWGAYSVLVDFSIPQSETGIVEVYSSSAQDGSKQNVIQIPVQFQSFEEPEVTIYFSNSIQDPGALECEKVYPVIRKVSGEQQRVIAAISALLAGPTEEEIELGYFSLIPEENVVVNHVAYDQGGLVVDFNQALQQGVAGSCTVQAIRSQIFETLRQFSDTDQVIITIDGQEDEILQP